MILLIILLNFLGLLLSLYGKKIGLLFILSALILAISGDNIFICILVFVATLGLWQVILSLFKARY